MEDRFVEQDKEHVVQVLMMVVLQKLQSVQNMDTVNVLHINLEVLNGVQALEKLLEVKEEDKQTEKEDKCVVWDKVPVVLVLMMVVLQKLQFVQNMDIVSVLHINQEVLHVVLGFHDVMMYIK